MTFSDFSPHWAAIVAFSGSVAMLVGSCQAGCSAWERSQALVDIHASAHQRCPSLEEARSKYGNAVLPEQTIASWDRGPLEEPGADIPRSGKSPSKECKYLTKICRYVVTTEWEAKEEKPAGERLLWILELPCE